MYSIVDMDLFKHDPAVEEFLEHLFPNDVHEYDPDALAAYVASSSSKEIDPRVAPDMPPVTICTGRRPDLRLLRIFGCRVYALPPGKRKTKLDVNAKQGIFLGYHKTFHHVYYFDLDTKKIKTCRHVAFDEGMLASDDPPPFARLLRDMPPAEDDDNDLEEVELKEPVVDVSLSPFTSQVELVFPFDPGSAHPLGFSVGKCSRQLRAFATAINAAPARYSLRSAAKRFTGGYILAVQDINVFSPEDVEEVITQFRSLPTPPTTVTVRIANDLLSDLRDDRAPPLHLRAIDLRRSAALTLVAGEGMTSFEYNRAVTALSTSPSVGHTPSDPDDLVSLNSSEILEMRRLQVSHMTDEEKQLTSFTRRNVMKLKNWKDWRDADDLQLDQHFAFVVESIPHDADLPSFPAFPMDELVAFLDAAHATDIKSRRSVTGLIIVLCGAAITWKSRLQATVATSLTEAEFLAAVLTAKLVKYLRSVLLELGFLHASPSTLYVDNQATVDIVNERRPTPRSRHIEVQHFAIQEWHANKDIVMRHLAGILNPSDDLTKALGWVLHARHARRGMGHYGPSSDYRVHDG
jgi:hypothetical protein